MKIKTNILSLWLFLATFSILFSSCMRLNGKYCTNSDLSGYCKTFDNKDKMIVSHFSTCTGGDIKKGRYKRFGNLLVVDLIPYEDLAIDRHKITFLSEEKSDSINVKFKLVDSTGQEGAIGVEIYFSNDKKGKKYKISTDIEGKANIKISINDLPLNVETRYVGYRKVSFALSEKQDSEIRIEFIDDGFITKSQKIGREYYHIKRIKKGSFACKQIHDLSEWKFTEEELQYRMLYYSKQKN